LVGEVPEAGAECVGVVLYRDAVVAEVVEKVEHRAANGVRVVELVVADTEVDAEAAGARGRVAGQQRPERAGDGGAFGFDDFVTQEVRWCGLLLELIHRAGELGLHGGEHG
jgi:hypothetical protein